MDAIVALLPLALAMVLTGLVAGVLAGLLGVGGGIVIVPVLDAVLGSLGVDPAVRLHVAVATSLATIIPTSLASSRAHYRRGAVDLDVTRFWAPFVLLGSVAGTVLATRLSGATLALIFAGLALLVAIKLLLPLEGVQLSKSVPRTVFGALPPAGIGLLSSMLGIGGGTLSVPALTLMGESMHRAVGTAALFGLLISLPGTLAYIVVGWGDPRLPTGSIGYVNLPGLLLISPATVLAAPLGARLAHRLSAGHLRLAFGLFLLVVAARMLWRAAQSVG